MCYFSTACGQRSSILAVYQNPLGNPQAVYIGGFHPMLPESVVGLTRLCFELALRECLQAVRVERYCGGSLRVWNMGKVPGMRGGLWGHKAAGGWAQSPLESI